MKQFEIQLARVFKFTKLHTGRP